MFARMLLVCLLSLCLFSSAGADEVIGRALATQYCSGCHAIGEAGQGTHPDAPTFRSLSERYPIDTLEQMFVDSIDTGHPAMPVFEASPQQIDHILDYIASVLREH